MLLFVGLGNPGERYVGNRHNIGFMAVQAIAKRHGIAPWRRRFQGVAVEGTIGTEKVLLLLPGTVRLKIGGGNAGHNGLRSISEHIGNDYRRVRLGVGHPGNKDMMESYVLQDFAKSERSWVEALCDIVADNAALLVEGKNSTFQNKVHLAMLSLIHISEPTRRTPISYA